MNELVLKDIHVSLGGHKILEGINFDVKKGELVSLLGQSGCGKSTLLKTIAGIIASDRGEISIGGMLCNDIPCEKRCTVIVFQDLRLFPHMNVEENIEFGLKMKGVEKNIRKNVVLDIMKKIHLSGLEKRKVHELSGGQIQRVALARAIASNPRVLLLDEPFSSLDESLRQKMRELVVVLQKEFNITTVMVTHDYQEALMMSDRVAVMIAGKIVQYDSPKNVYEHPASPEVADYFGEVNYIEGIVENNQFNSELGKFQVSLEDGKYSAMLRPNNIKILKKEGNFELISKRYLGDKYNFKIRGYNTELFIDMEMDMELQLGNLVDVELDLLKAVFYKIL